MIESIREGSGQERRGEGRGRGRGGEGRRGGTEAKTKVYLVVGSNPGKQGGVECAGRWWRQRGGKGGD